MNFQDKMNNTSSQFNSLECKEIPHQCNDENIEQKTHVRRGSIHKNPEDEDKYEQFSLQANIRSLFDESFKGDLIDAYKKLLSFDRLWQKLPFYDREAVFLISVDAGSVCLYAQMDEQAKPWLEKAEEFSPSWHVGLTEMLTYYLVRMYNMLGDLSTRNNQEGLAISYLTKAKEIIEADPPDVGRSLSWNNHNMAEVYLLDKDNIGEDENQYRLKMAEKLMLSALSVRLGLSRSRLLAYSYEALTRLEIKKKNFVQANQYFESAKNALEDLRASRKKEGYRAISEFFLRGKCLCNLGQILHATQEKEEGGKNYIKGIKILDKTLPQGNALSKKYREEGQKLFNGFNALDKQGDRKQYLEDDDTDWIRITTVTEYTEGPGSISSSLTGSDHP